MILTSSSKNVTILNEAEIQQVAASDGAMTMNIPLFASNKGFVLLINGLSQNKSEYTVTSGMVTLPSTLNIIAGDHITYRYFYL
jgi:hypothetical protein